MEEVVTFEINEHGLPFFPATDRLNVNLYASLDVKDESDWKNQIEISGNSDSLRRLGEILIGLSMTKDYHIHLDSNSTGPIKAWPEDFVLTLSNTDKQKSKADGA
ncbi:hypothetical protein [Gimesia panareensis]|uniref:Imm32 family immunity protein n=1 Tax=Gimesia panareensis TaxID=2527978 RepID=UPI0011A8C5DF|nr:hypothetical protein [Gimesia panareensis]